jgi:hypothetical protein
MSDIDHDGPAPEPMASGVEREPDLGLVLEKLETLLAEVRRQGRAGVAAQAAAEACLAGLHAMVSPPSTRPVEALRKEPTARELDGRAVSLLIPLFDAIDGAVHQVRAVRPAETRAVSRGLGQALWSELMRLRERSEDSSPQDSVRLGLEMIQAEARSALARLGVELEDRIGVPVDPERHRVIQVHAGENGEGERATVLLVLRPGYVVRGVCVREADVVASRSH